MTFEEVLNESVAMLKRQGRVSYRALKRQFDLDDDDLADLKEALTFSHPRACDEEGHRSRRRLCLRQACEDQTDSSHAAKYELVVYSHDCVPRLSELLGERRY